MTAELWAAAIAELERELGREPAYRAYYRWMVTAKRRREPMTVVLRRRGVPLGRLARLRRWAEMTVLLAQLRWLEQEERNDG
jgi:hypothetical protein